MKKLIFFLFTWLLFVTTSSFATTRYVKIGGSDGAAGTSWATAWATVSKVNTTLAGGDTVFFGTGTWYNSQITPPTGASFSDRTCYACSSFVMNHPAKIYGGDSLSKAGWSVYSGSIYKHYWVGSGCYYNKICYTLGQDDSLLRPVTAMPGSAGRFYHKSSVDTIYAWLYGNENPANHTMIASCKPAVLIESNASYTTLWGLDFKYGKQGTIFFYDDGSDSFFIDHCNISRCGYTNQENASAIFITNILSDSSQSPSWMRVRACSLGHMVDVNMDAWRMGLCMYGEKHMTVESCYVYGPIGDGLDFKGNNAPMPGNKMLFNTIKGATQYGIVVHSRAYCDTIAGNIIIGTGSTPESGIEPMGLQDYGGSVYLNNTIYNCQYRYLESGAEGTHAGTQKFRYNIGSGGVSEYVINFNGATEYTHWSVDSNMYYDHTSPTWSANGDFTWSTWKSTRGFDTHGSDGVNPSFNNPSADDFSRPGSSQEMNLTYCGRTWTRYGAWQPSGGDETAPDSVKNVVCTETTAVSVILKCKKNDSTDCGGYMVRYAAGATSPATYNAGTFGDSTSSRTDTTFGVTGLTANTQYSFSIFARDEVPNWSVKGPGSSKTVTTDPSPDTSPPDIVSGVACTETTDNSVALRCDQADSADCGGYMVRYLQGATAPTAYNLGIFGDSTSLKTDTVFGVTGLIQNTQYSFTVFARDEVPNWSGANAGSKKTVTTDTETTPPDTVTGVDTTLVTSQNVYLVCDKNDSADCGGYMVRYALGATAPTTYNGGTFGDSTSSRDDTSFIVINLAANTEYSFTVFARDEVPNWSGANAESKMTITTKQVTTVGVMIGLINSGDNMYLGSFGDSTFPSDTVRLDFTSKDTTASVADVDTYFVRRYFGDSLLDSSLYTATQNKVRLGYYQVPFKAKSGSNYGKYYVELEVHKQGRQAKASAWYEVYRRFKGRDFYQQVYSINSLTDDTIKITSLAARDTSKVNLDSLRLLLTRFADLKSLAEIHLDDSLGMVKDVVLSQLNIMLSNIYAEMSTFSADSESTYVKGGKIDTVTYVDTLAKGGGGSSGVVVVQDTTTTGRTLASLGDSNSFKAKGFSTHSAADVKALFSDTLSKLIIRIDSLLHVSGYDEDTTLLTFLRYIRYNQSDYKATGFSTFNPAITPVVAADTNASGDTLARQKDSTSFQGSGGATSQQVWEYAERGLTEPVVPSETTDAGKKIATEDTLGNLATAIQGWFADIKLALGDTMSKYGLTQAQKDTMFHAVDSFYNTTFGGGGATPAELWGYGGNKQIDTCGYLLAGAGAGASAKEVADTLTLRGWMIGAGPNVCSLYVLTASDSGAVANIPVSVLNSGFSATMAQNMTAPSGAAFFKLSNGSYKVLTSNPAYPQINDYDTFTVSGTSQDTIWVERFDPGSAPSPDQCLVYGWTVGSAVITAKNPTMPLRYGNLVISPYAVTDTANANGYWEMSLYPNSLLTPATTQYEFWQRIPQGSLVRVKATVPDSSSWQFTW